MGSLRKSGSLPCSVPKTATTDSANAAVTAPRWSNRNAAKRSTGITRNLGGAESKGAGKTPLYTMRPMPTTDASIARASTTRRRGHRGQGSVPQMTIRGATITAPTRSPSHQVVQIGQNLSHGASPTRDKLVTPNVALTVVLSMAARTTNLRISGARSNALAPVANRFTRKAPIKACSVLPVAMPVVAWIEHEVVMLTRKAPSQMPGQIRYPKEEHGRDGDPGQGPDGGGAVMEERERETESSREEIGRAEDGDLHGIEVGLARRPRRGGTRSGEVSLGGHAPWIRTYFITPRSVRSAHARWKKPA